MDSHFIDEVEITVSSGKGGDGMVHFRRERFVPRGGPDGGDGGRGGSVILEVEDSMRTLYNFRRQKKFAAEEGRPGGPSNRSGRGAPDLVLKVPAGTLVYDASRGDLLADLVQAGERYEAARGGRGGRGNQHFANSRNQAPRIGEKGAPGEEKTLRLELKLLADIGIVGVPNAGKSTLLAALTNARPRIANYPFTTLAPNLGVAVLDEETDLVLADIPGLIEGAHTGKGLGHDFLRHIQRTRVLIHLLDGMAEAPLADYTQINSELALFDPQLGSKPQVVAVNKIDLPDVQARWPELQAGLKKLGVATPLAISAVSGHDVRRLLGRAAEALRALPEPVADELPVYRPETDPTEFEITREPDGWRLHGAAIERAAAMTYWEHDQSVSRFQRILRQLKIDVALREKGVVDGDTVFIGEYELEWKD
ncbi:MAG: GTPase ObgE [Anaerolineales bacterium]|nr:GTPase ObgE [Anaerolineales bacterium]